MNMKPLGDRVVVKMVETEQVTRGGIVLPDTAKEKPQEGEVLAVGPGRLMENGTYAPMPVAVGDKVLFAKYGGTELKRDGETYMILSAERDILVILG